MDVAFWKRAAYSSYLWGILVICGCAKGFDSNTVGRASFGCEGLCLGRKYPAKQDYFTASRAIGIRLVAT